MNLERYPVSSPIGRVMDALAVNGGRPKRSGAWTMFRCPAHADGNASLGVTVGDTGKVVLKCHAGCEIASIVSAIGLEMSDLFPEDSSSVKEPTRGRAATLDELAEHKKLPAAFLRELGWADNPRGGTDIPYRTRDGQLHLTKTRRGLSIKDGMFVAPSGRPAMAYEPDGGELARSEGFLILVEGETDTATLLHAGFPALGLPGADTVERTLLAHHLEGIRRVFYVREPDAGGDTFAKLVPARLKALGFTGESYELRLPNAAKDPSVLWQRDPKGFRDAFAGLLEAVCKPKWQWLSESATTVLKPLGERMTTGLATLDEATRGGIPQGRFIAILGAPGAAKTTLSVYLADRWERAGATVFYLAADEPAEGITMRLGQLSGWSRTLLEDDSDAGNSVRVGFAKRSAGRRIAVLDPDTYGLTLEDAHKALLEAGKGTPKVLVVDSLQTVRCAASQGLESSRERIDAVVATCKHIAQSSGIVVVGISEMSRAGYRGGEGGNISALAAGKETGGIEYNVALLLGLRSVKGERGVVEVEVAKNRIGFDKPDFRMQIDFDRASLAEIGMPDKDGERASAAASARQQLRDRIRAAVGASQVPLTSKNGIRAAVGSSRSETFDAIDEMVVRGELVIENGQYKAGPRT